MNYTEFISITGLANKVLSITRQTEGTPTKGVFPEKCMLSCFDQIFQGTTVCLTPSSPTCLGSRTGVGFVDALAPKPGGFGYFISSGRGEGFPEGERLKSCPENGERMIMAQPQDVLNGCQAVTIKPYTEGERADVVSIFCNADQLAAMIQLFNYRKSGDHYDTVIAPAVSGCASLFRIPFGELKRDEPRAVIGCSDITIRSLFPAALLPLTVSYRDFLNMLYDADESFLKTKNWEKLRSRLPNDTTATL